MARPLDIDAHAERLARHFTVVTPDGPGPHPVVIQLHGCGGRQPFHDSYAEAARQAGIASVVVDSFAPRGIGKRLAQMTVCTGLQLHGRERAADLLAVLHWLDHQPWADTSRLAAAGWSHGGWTVMDALAGALSTHSVARSQPERLAGLKAVFLVYPYAGPMTLTHRSGWGPHRPKVAAVLGTRDAVVGQAAPRRALDRLVRDGLEVEVMTLEGATHSFDDPDADDPRTRYDAGHSARARRFLTDTLTAAFQG
jgi:dienelactone hydrolase